MDGELRSTRDDPTRDDPSRDNPFQGDEAARRAGSVEDDVDDVAEDEASSDDERPLPDDDRR